jgi:ABC-2 type transport system ATP-binding protein
MNPQSNPINSRSDIVVLMRHVTRFFENPGFIRALTNVSLEIRRGEIFGLLGPSGSGKSTALRILSGNLSASEGKAKVFGRSPRRHSIKSRIGYLPQEDAHLQRNIILRILAFLPELFAGNRKSAINSPPQAAPRRCGSLAQILAKAPDLIILDEPFSGLDPAGCAEFKELLRTLAHRGRTIMLSGDSLSETKDICDRIAVLYAGTIQAIGTLPELLTHSDAIRFTAPLLPPATADRVLHIICNDLTGVLPAPAIALDPTHSDLPEQYLPAQSSKPDHIANQLLAPLLKKEISLSVEPAVPAVQVNHDKLAKLTRRTD